MIFSNNYDEEDEDEYFDIEYSYFESELEEMEEMEDLEDPYLIELVEEQKQEEEQQEQSFEKVEQDFFEYHDLSINQNNYLFNVKDVLFVFIDSEFEDEIYISLEVFCCYYKNDEYHSFSYIVFNEDFRFFVEKSFSSFEYYKNIKVEILFSIFDEKTNVLVETLSEMLQKHKTKEQTSWLTPRS